jgi:hypothetical protein
VEALSSEVLSTKPAEQDATIAAGASAAPSTVVGIVSAARSRPAALPFFISDYARSSSR